MEALTRDLKKVIHRRSSRYSLSSFIELCRSHPEKVHGIYTLWEKQGDKFEMIYLGKSNDDIFSRVREHLATILNSFCNNRTRNSKEFTENDFDLEKFFNSKFIKDIFCFDVKRRTLNLEFAELIKRVQKNGEEFSTRYILFSWYLFNRYSRKKAQRILDNLPKFQEKIKRTDFDHFINRRYIKGMKPTSNERDIYFGFVESHQLREVVGKSRVNIDKFKEVFNLNKNGVPKQYEKNDNIINSLCEGIILNDYYVKNQFRLPLLNEVKPRIGGVTHIHTKGVSIKKSKQLKD
ncbi:MAG: hypothetical protein COC01_03540 [Bacteroidetes bacterium]|nr:hypothetical protein [Bacteroidia bacterium]MBN4052349.1 hypothetical protein [Sphingobacteriaceae bacterium AH-315-L07]PCH68576.1 MAG: hypothetical protein COC01_03540 [Bacteroidota bacterium]